MHVFLQNSKFQNDLHPCNVKFVLERIYSTVLTDQMVQEPIKALAPLLTYNYACVQIMRKSGN